VGGVMIKNLYVVFMFGILFGVILAMPFQSVERVVVSADGGGGGDCCNPFNQSLNTTDDADFNTVNVSDSYYLDGVSLIRGNNTVHSFFIGEDAGDDSDDQETCYIGFKAGYRADGGANTRNVGIGSYALYYNEGISCIGLGYASGQANDADKGVFIGEFAGYNNDGDAVYVNDIGYYAGYFNDGSNCNFIGYRAGLMNTENFCTGVGTNALGYNEGLYGNAIGYYSGYQNEGTYPVFMGSYTGQKNTGSNCVGIGSQSMRYNEGSYGAGLGYYAGYKNKGFALSGFGYRAGYEAGTNADYCSLFGYSAGRKINGTNNVYIGKDSGYEASVSHDVSALGYSTGYTAIGNYSVYVGSRAGYNHDGDHCMYFGEGAGMNLAETQTFRMKMENVNRFDLICGNFSTGNVAINTSTINYDYALDVNGDIECESLDEVSDMRAKTFISGLGKNKVKSFCENVSIWGFVWNEYGYNTVNETVVINMSEVIGGYIDNETGEWIEIFNNYTVYENISRPTDLYFGEPTDEFDIGIPAQLLFNYVSDTFGEEFAHAIVHVPENDSVELWNVNYKSVSMIFARYSQIIANELKQLEDRVNALEEFLSLYGYVPPE